MKVFHISASGLKNIIFASDENEDFRFVIGSEEIKIQRILAEFISPLVSHIHHSDPTIDSLSLNKFIRYEKQEDINKIITTELIENIKKISCGYSIEIDDDMINKLQFFSILIGNEEMYNEINKLYSKQSTKEKMYKNIKFLEIIDIESIESKSAVDKGIINVTGSSTTDNLSSSQPLNAVDYQNIDSKFYTKNLPNQWLCIDFKERKVNPSHYSVRSHAWKSNWFNIQSWCIEGSNDGNAWTTLDTRNGDKSLDGSNASNTFTIPSHSKSTNFYQFLRLRQTGVNTYNKNNALILTGLEFFGTVKE